ncbi:MAG: hypothetical protein IH626_09950 [Rhodospirillales bacterium]|nr:hypothetical protein [Rhodospirillales bacterium]
MAAELLAGIEGSVLATALRGSTWVYPLVNAGHIIGIALLFGAIVPVDLRLIGVWREVPLALFLRVLVPVAAAGLAVAAVFGLLLFAANAKDYVASGFFLAKMAMLALGIANALTFHALRRRHVPDDPGRDFSWQRLIGATSLAVWLAVIVLGRLIGYF